MSYKALQAPPDSFLGPATRLHIIHSVARNSVKLPPGPGDEPGYSHLNMLKSMDI